jgi:hypothetical protein
VTAGEQIGRQARYGLLLATLIAVYLLSALGSGRPIQDVQLVLVVAVALIALRNTDFPHRNAARWAALAGSVLAIALVASSGSAVARGIGSIWTAILLLATVVIIVDGVLKLETVTLQSIYAALSAYMLIGLMFAAVFGAIDGLGGTDFFANGESANLRTYQYFSFTTLTTLGYGDFTAAGSFGRAVAVLEAITGQVFLATLVARLVSAYRGPARRDPPPGGAPDGGAASNGSAGTAADGSAAPPELAARIRTGGPRRRRPVGRRGDREFVLQDQAGHDLEQAEDEQPDPDQHGQHGDGRQRAHGDHDPGDQADRPEHRPPDGALARPAERGHQPRYPLDDPAEADQQADEGQGHVQVADQHHAERDEEQAGDAQPEAVPRRPVSRPDQVEDPRDDRGDADQDGEHAQRAVRMGGDDDPEDDRDQAEHQRRLPAVDHQQHRRWRLARTVVVHVRSFLSAGISQRTASR